MKLDVKSTGVAQRFTGVTASPKRRLRRTAVHTPTSWPSTCCLHHSFNPPLCLANKFLSHSPGHYKTHRGPISTATVDFVTFRERRSRGEMYTGNGRLCVCVSVPRRIPTLLHGPGCKLGKQYGCPLVVHYWADLQSVHGFRC